METESAKLDPAKQEPEKREDFTKPFPKNCSVCGRECWIAKSGYPDGDVKSRLLLLMRREPMCMKCFDQLSSSKP